MELNYLIIWNLKLSMFGNINKEAGEGKMEKVLVHNDESEDIHYIKGSFLGTNRTLCGQHLHPISTIHVHKFDVTCKKCLNIFEEKKIKMNNTHRK